jgi:hypothetical protein
MLARNTRLWIGRSLALAILYVLLVPKDARAYTDPATGSMILQLLMAGAVTAAFYFRRWLARFFGLFRRGHRESDK